MKKQIIVALLITALFAGTAMAKPGNAEKGAEIYNKRCVWCHGEQGDGLGPGADMMNPPPRDFTSAMYKIKTSSFEDVVPNEEDIFRMIAEGMPGTDMPGWKDVLTEQDMWDLVAYLKTFAGIEGEKPAKQIDYGSQIQSSEESLKKGKELYLDRCAECHGKAGKGVAIKKLKDDLGYRTWPRNLTKPWTFRASGDVKDIYARISTGIPGTQMPNFADPNSQKKLTSEERWHVANYVASLAEKQNVVKGEKTVVKASQMEGPLPDSPEDEKWAGAEATSFYMLPQIIGKERFFKNSNDQINVKALYNDKEIALLLEWDDRTNSAPGNVDAQNIADDQIFEDSVAVQFPVTIPETSEKPYFGMGDAANPVNIWQWKGGATEKPESTHLMNSKGFGAIERREAAAIGLTTKGAYDNGTWRVVMKRSLAAGNKETDISIDAGKFIPIAFAAWDGSNSETGSKHTMTTWYWLFLKPAASANVYFIPAIVFFGILGLEFWWAANAGKKKK